MKSLTRLLGRASAVLALAFLQACGGGGGGGGSDPPAENPPVTQLKWDNGSWDQLNWQ